MKYLLFLLAVLTLSSSQPDVEHKIETHNTLAELEKAAKEAELPDKLMDTGSEATSLLKDLMQAEIQDDVGDDQDLEKLLNNQAESQQNDEPQLGEEENAMAAQDVAKAQRSKRYWYNRMRMYRRYYRIYRHHYYRQRNLHLKYRHLYSVYYRSNKWCLHKLTRG